MNLYLIKTKLKNIFKAYQPKHVIKKIAISEYQEITTVADHLKQGCSVILDLSKMPDIKLRRCIDFIAGVLYSVNGKIERTGEHGSKLYLLTPDKVVIDQEYKKTMMNLDLKKV